MNEEKIKLIKELMLCDFNNIIDYFGLRDEGIEPPEFDIIESFEMDAKMELGSCKLLCSPIDWKTVTINSINKIRIFIGSIKNFIKEFFKATRVGEYSRLLLHCIRYVSIHEIMHYIQLKSGVTMNIDDEKPAETISKNVETMCIDGLKDFIKNCHRDDRVMVNLLRIDEENLNGIKTNTDVTERIEKIASEITSELIV